MDTSMTATSGPSSVARGRAPSPSAASATTSMSAWASIRARSPARTTLWSSARSTRSLAVMTRLPRWSTEGDAGSHRRPLAVARLDQEGPAHQAHPLAHPEQAQSPAARPRPDPLRVEPPAVILDQGGQLVPAPLHDHADLPRRGVLGDVVQRLLHDPIDRRLDVQRQAVAVQAHGLEVG